MTSNAKIFADGTSLFSVVHDVNTSAKELNDDLKKVIDWVFQWKISFNLDPSKQAQEVIFICKSKRSTHPPLVFNNNDVSQTFSQKNLGVILDFKLTFEKHLNNVLAKVNKAVGLLRKLRNYQKLGLESRRDRRWCRYRKLCLFYKVLENEYPKYLFNLIPNRHSLYSTRNIHNIPPS